MQGGCHALALKIVERTGWPMAAAWFRRGRKVEIGHVVVVQPGQDFGENKLASLVVVDICGERGWPEIFSDLDFDPENEEVDIRLVTVDDIVAMTKARSSRKLPALTEELLADAETTADKVLAAIGYDAATAPAC